MQIPARPSSLALVAVGWPLLMFAVVFLNLGGPVVGVLLLSIIVWAMKGRLRHAEDAARANRWFRRVAGWLVLWLFLMTGMYFGFPLVRQRYWESVAAPLPELGAFVHVRGGRWQVRCLDQKIDDSAFQLWMPHLRRLNIITLDLEGCRLTDKSTSDLRFLTNLEYLDLSNTDVSDGTLAGLSALPQLRRLLLSGTRITDNGLRYLRQAIHLQYLDLRRTHVSDTGLQELAGLRDLRHVDARSTKVTRSGAEALKRALPEVWINIDQ